MGIARRLRSLRARERAPRAWRRKLRSTALTRPLRRGESQPRRSSAPRDRRPRAAPRACARAGRAPSAAGRAAASSRERPLEQLVEQRLERAEEAQRAVGEILQSAARSRAASRGCARHSAASSASRLRPASTRPTAAAREPLDFNHRSAPKRAPAASLKPARNAPAASRLPPARCSSVTRKPSRPHATTMPRGARCAHRARRAGAAPASTRARQIFSAAPSSCVCGAGRGIERAHLALDVLRRAAPVDPRLAPCRSSRA